MDYFDFNMQLTDEWSESKPEKTPLTKTPVRATYSLMCTVAHSPAAEQVGTPFETSGEGTTARITVSVSYAFHPNTRFDDVGPDLILASSDQVLFYVHFHRILAASENSFAMLLPSSSGQLTMDKDLQSVLIPEPAQVLNIVVHTIYEMSALDFHPSFETVSVALDAVSRFGLPPKRYAAVGQPLYELIVSSAPLRPIDTYALAAKHDLADAAAATSAHLLAFPLQTITDELATSIGPIYLKKLFFFHSGRVEALKHALVQPPDTHPETPECSLAQQRCLVRAWALAAAHMMWDASPSECTRDMGISR